MLRRILLRQKGEDFIREKFRDFGKVAKPLPVWRCRQSWNRRFLISDKVSPPERNRTSRLKKELSSLFALKTLVKQPKSGHSLIILNRDNQLFLLESRRKRLFKHWVCCLNQLEQRQSSGQQWERVCVSHFLAPASQTISLFQPSAAASTLSLPSLLLWVYEVFLN